ncbi:hypothetical protein BJV82DRAFT_585804 [Fennellomyces sp. T-0311]|nr:hypothetical protein BJV82DRAFT_585804 [Fennellomyces sp. T-0311]
MRRLSWSTIIILASIFRLGLGDTGSPRTYGIRFYLQRKIFCGGGVDLTTEARQQPDMVTLDDFYYLDISGDFAVSNVSSARVRILAQGTL